MRRKITLFDIFMYIVYFASIVIGILFVKWGVEQTLIFDFDGGETFEGVGGSIIAGISLILFGIVKAYERWTDSL